MTPATLTVTAANETKAYGAANPTLTVTYSGFVNGDTAASLTTPATASTTATAASPVGTLSDHGERRGQPELHDQLRERHADRDGGHADGDGDQPDEGVRRGESDVDGDATAASSTATRRRASRRRPSAATTATTASTVGTYPITASGAVSSNYTISYVSGTLTVTAATLTVTAANETKTYGAVNPALTVTYSGFVNGDTVANLTTPATATTMATTASSVGTYAITASGAASPNYTLSYAPGALTVTPADADGDGVQRDEDVRRREPDVDGELQRLRQRRHGGEPGDTGDRVDDGNGGERRWDVSDHRDRRGEPQLHDRLRGRLADGHDRRR